MAGRSKCVNRVSHEIDALRETDCGLLGASSRFIRGEGHADIADLELTMIGLPGVLGDGMPGKNA